LTGLNLYNMPASIQGFYGDGITASETMTADVIAWVLNAAIIALLVWTIYELRKGNRRLAQAVAADGKTN